MSARFLLLAFAVVVFGASLLSAGDTANPPAERLGVETDIAGNVVRTEEGEKILIPPERIVDLDTAGAATLTRPPAKVLGAPGTEGPYTLALDRVWRYMVWGTSLGRNGMVPVDLDGDGRLEIVMGTSLEGDFARNSRWFVLRHDPASGDYSMTWSSGFVDGGVSHVAVHATGGQPRVFVGLGTGTLLVHNGATLAEEARVDAANSDIRDILLADADNDGNEELLVVTENTLHLLDATTYAEESQIPYGAWNTAVGNVDADPELEIVLVSGPVLQYDGSSVVVEWDFSSFAEGRYLGLADLDADGMDEIVAARSWYYIDVYDADIQSPQFQIRTDLDIQALLLADVTGDGREEVLYGDGQWGEIHAMDGTTGDELWNIHNPEHGTTRIAVADTDNDGELEVMWGGGWTSTSEDLFFVHGVESGELEFVSTDLVGPFAAVATGDPDDDGHEEIVAISWESNSGRDDGVIHVFDATTYELEWRSGTALFQRFSWTGVRDVAIGDVDDDGFSEIVVGTDRLYDGAIYVIDGASHVVEAQYLYDSGSPIQALTLSDFDGDGQTEILAGNYRAHTGSPGVFLYVIDGATGAVEWKSVSLGSTWYGIYALEIADLDNDGSLDAILSADTVAVVDGATRTCRLSTATGIVGLDVADFDGDGQQEIWVGTSGGELATLDPVSLELSTVATVCTESVNSVRLDRAGTLGGSVQFACDDDLAVYGVFEDAILWRSESLGSPVGYLNNLVVGDRDDRALLIAGTRYGVMAYEGYGTSNTDVDEDGVANHLDNCPETPNPDQADTDGDGVGDACNDGLDGDGDEWADILDNCPGTANPDQGDADGNGVGDACNDHEDGDGDEWADNLDNCPELANADQADRDGDLIGDACDPYPDNPDNYAARCEEAIENEALLTEQLLICLAQPKFEDADGDGEADLTDACPETLEGEEVDAAGCSWWQFCTALDGRGQGAAICANSDWKNDEVLGNPQDCKVEGATCVPRYTRPTVPKGHTGPDFSEDPRRP